MGIHNLYAREFLCSMEFLFMNYSFIKSEVIITPHKSYYIMNNN